MGVIKLNGTNYMGGGSGGGDSGHTIINPNGYPMTQRDGLQFTGGVSITDDSTNNKTIINVSNGGGYVDGSVSPNPQGAATDTLETIGFESVVPSYVMENGQIGTSAGYYVYASFSSNLVTGTTYKYVIRDASSTLNGSFVWGGSTTWIELSANMRMTIEVARAGLTYYSGSWRNIYCDMFSETTTNTIYDVGGGGSDVSVQALQVTGDKLATITVSGIDHDIYSPDSKTFSMAVSRANIESGETYATIFGKIKKWFNDLPSMFVDKTGDTMSGQLTVQNDVEITGDLYAPYVYADSINYHDSITNKSLNITKPQTISTGGTIQVPDKGGTMALISDISVNDVEVNGTSVVDQNKVAKITSYKEVTRAEYEALPDTKFTDGVAYFISDNGSAKVQGYPPLIYSLEEREVGVWTDGKPLYQKTFTFSFTCTSDDQTTIIETLASDIDVKIISEGYVSRDNARFKSGIYPPADIYYIFRTNDINNALDIRIGNSNGNLISGNVTIQYTKTTDTAGSSKWNGQGGLACHYSTAETIVGTWIDGKVMYERTIRMNNDFSSTKTYAIPEADNLILVDGFYTCTSGNTQYQVPLNYTESSYTSYTGWNKTLKNVYFRLNGFTSSEVCARVRYTKTT